MNIEVTFKNSNIRAQLDYLEFGNGRDTITLSWDSSGISPGVFYGSGVCFTENDEDVPANGRLCEIMNRKLTGLQVYDEETNREYDWIEIEAIEMEDGDNVYHVPDCLLYRFQKHEIHETSETAEVHLDLNREEYELIAKHVRDADMLECMKNGIIYGFSEAAYQNVSASLLQLADENPTGMISLYKVCANGDEEYSLLQEIVDANGGMGYYRLISNMDSENETENELILLVKDAKHLEDDIRELNNGADVPFTEGELFYMDTSGELVDLFFVDDIQFIREAKICG